MERVKLYLVRHAVAAARGEAYPDDSKRPLTPKGTAAFRKVVAGLDRLGVRVDVVLTSPLTRARQTADVLAKHLRSKAAIVETRCLAPGISAQAVLQELRDYQDRGAIALVGHEPGLGALAARLIGAHGELAFKKGGVCRIDFEGVPRAGAGRLRWFATPRMLRKVGEQ